MGECQVPFDIQLGRFYFEKAFEKFRTEEGGVGIFLAWAGVVNSIMDVKESWALSMNERLKTKFMFYISELGDHWQKTGQWEKAVQCYLRGLEIDDLSEDFYRALMVCYQKLDRRAEAIAVFRRCQRILSNTLHMEPSAKTKSIFKALVSEKRGSGEPAPLS